jgi:lipopolysaccharide/colanic/teichoic acid biosynthesis glycosyltransferase
MNRAKLSQKFQFRNAEISFNNFERVRLGLMGKKITILKLRHRHSENESKMNEIVDQTTLLTSKNRLR